MDLNILTSRSIGLVLAGGGVRGVAHIGVIKALNELGISVDKISGSSVGALVGALYANGNSISDMLTFFKETPLFKYNFLTIVKPGLIDTERYFDIFKGYFPENTFEALDRKLFVVATDLLKGEQEFFSSGELIRPLLASAALPPVFSPVSLNNSLYADGGIMNNFPLEPLMETTDFVIGSNVSITGEVDKSAIRNSLQLTGRVTGLMIYASSKEKINTCDLLLEPKALENVGVLDKKGIETAFTIGYDHTMKTFMEFLKDN